MEKRIDRAWRGLVTLVKKLPTLPVTLFGVVEKNLAFLLMVAGAWHYYKVLENYDNVVVAVSLGILVDVGSYHAIKIATRYRYGIDAHGKQHGRRSQAIIRWSVALVMTVISLYYHLVYYEPRLLVAQFILAFPIPILIAAISYFGWVDGNVPGKKEEEPPKVEVPAAGPEAPARYRKLLQDGNHKAAAFAIWRESPDMEAEEVGNLIGRSARMVRNYRKEFDGSR